MNTHIHVNKQQSMEFLGDVFYSNVSYQSLYVCQYIRVDVRLSLKLKYIAKDSMNISV